MSGQGRPELATVEANDLALAIAATRWHAEITDALLDRAVAAAKACGVSELAVVRVACGAGWAPGGAGGGCPAGTTRWPAWARSSGAAPRTSSTSATR